MTDEEFLALSVALTGFSEAELRATGMVEDYWRLLRERVPETLLHDVCVHVTADSGPASPPAGCTDAEERSKRRRMAVACAVTEMWYLGVWPGLWPDVYADIAGGNRTDGNRTDGNSTDSATAVTRQQPADADRGTACAPGATGAAASFPNTPVVVSPQAYVESLVWKTFDGHPMGAKPPGYGSWSLRPVSHRTGDEVTWCD